ncbi:universal stress protein [Emticicia oligotrophica]|uniref:universal stress protein n=1 Tax=Emticicia oligotrophica TaxID=312279 RepID=UPI00273CE7E6|nr:universal stress protein [Emticicia oligotrophica]
MKKNDNGIKMPLATQRIRKILIAVDLEKNSENLIMYSIVVTKSILCEYTLLHYHREKILDSKNVEKVNLLLQKVKNVYNVDVKSVFGQEIATEQISAKITELHSIEHFDTIVIGTSNTPNSWKMGSVSTQILRKVPANILVVPPYISLAFPQNISILADTQQKADIEKLTAFNRYISQFSVFINFVFFVDSKEDLEEKQKAMRQYQTFFEANFTFNFILQAVRNLPNFLTKIEETLCESAVIAWNEDFMNVEQNSTNFPCSPQISIFYSKSSEPAENAFRLETPLR